MRVRSPASRPETPQERWCGAASRPPSGLTQRASNGGRTADGPCSGWAGSVVTRHTALIRDSAHGEPAHPARTFAEALGASRGMVPPVCPVYRHAGGTDSLIVGSRGWCSVAQYVLSHPFSLGLALRGHRLAAAQRAERGRRLLRVALACSARLRALTAPCGHRWPGQAEPPDLAGSEGSSTSSDLGSLRGRDQRKP